MNEFCHKVVIIQAVLRFFKISARLTMALSLLITIELKFIYKTSGITKIKAF